MKFGIGLVALAVSAVLAGVSFAADEKPVKIGIIDLQKIILESKRGKEAKDLLTKESDYRGRKLKDTDEGLKKKFSDLDKQRTVLSREAFQKKQEELFAERDRFSESVQTIQTDLRKKEQDLTQDIIDDVQAVVKEIAEKEGFSLVLEKGAGVMYAPDKFDITSRVLQQYDTQKGSPAGEKKK